MSKRELQAAKNQAAYWHAFAFLAIKGLRNEQDYQIAMLGAGHTAPEDDAVKAIKEEAENWRVEADKKAAAVLASMGEA